MGLVKTRRLAGGSIRAPLFSKRPRKDSFRRRPRHCAVRHIFEYVTYRVMGESDGHVRRWRDCWTCEDQAAARRGRLASPRTARPTGRRGRSPRPTRLCGSVANVGVLPVPMLPVSNWGLRLARAVHKMRCPKGQEIWYNLRRGEKRFRTVP